MNKKLEKAITSYFDKKNFNTIKDFHKDVSKMNIKERILQQVHDEAEKLYSEKEKGKK